MPTATNDYSKKLFKHGNSLALVFDKAILNMLKIDQGTPLDLSTNGDVLVIAPMRQKNQQKRFENSRARLPDVLKHIDEKNDDVLKTLVLSVLQKKMTSKRTRAPTDNIDVLAVAEAIPPYDDNQVLSDKTLDELTNYIIHLVEEDLLKKVIAHEQI